MDIPHDLNDKYKWVLDALVFVLTLIIDEIVKHPIGSFTSIGGLLYIWTRFRTQLILKKKAKQELKDAIQKNKNGEEQG